MYLNSLQNDFIEPIRCKFYAELLMKDHYSPYYLNIHHSIDFENNFHAYFIALNGTIYKYMNISPEFWNIHFFVLHENSTEHWKGG